MILSALKVGAKLSAGVAAIVFVAGLEGWQLARERWRQMRKR